MKRFFLGIAGFPVAHSLSPTIHNRWLKKSGLYLAFQVPPSRLRAFIRRMRGSPLDGLNVTIPHKEKIIPLLDRLSPEASAIGAVNTVMRRKGRLLGDNTDWSGFRSSFVDRFGSLYRKNVVILGGGGAARAIAYAVGREGAQAITIANRTVSHGRNLARHFAPLFPQTSFQAIPLKSRTLRPFLKMADCLINTTPVGQSGTAFAASPIQFLRKGTVVVDLVYNPPLTPLLREARKRGLPVMNGMAMLVAQAALSFRLWTGREPS